MMDEEMLRNVVGEVIAVALQPINERLRRMEEQFERLDGRVAGLEEQYTNLEGQIRQLNERVIRIENVGIETKEICEAMRSGKDVLVAQVSGGEKRIEIVENKQLRQDKRLDSHRNRIGAVEEELNLFHQSPL